MAGRSSPDWSLQGKGQDRPPVSGQRIPSKDNESLVSIRISLPRYVKDFTENPDAQAWRRSVEPDSLVRIYGSELYYFKYVPRSTDEVDLRMLPSHTVPTLGSRVGIRENRPAYSDFSVVITPPGGEQRSFAHIVGIEDEVVGFTRLQEMAFAPNSVGGKQALYTVLTTDRSFNPDQAGAPAIYTWESSGNITTHMYR